MSCSTSIASSVNIFTIGGKIAYSNEKNLSAGSSGSLNGEAFNTSGLGRVGLVLPPILSPYNNDGTYNLNGSAIGFANNITGTSISIPQPSTDDRPESVEYGKRPHSV